MSGCGPGGSRCGKPRPLRLGAFAVIPQRSDPDLRRLHVGARRKAEVEGARLYWLPTTLSLVIGLAVWPITWILPLTFMAAMARRMRRPARSPSRRRAGSRSTSRQSRPVPHDPPRCGAPGGRRSTRFRGMRQGSVRQPWRRLRQTTGPDDLLGLACAFSLEAASSAPGLGEGGRREPALRRSLSAGPRNCEPS